MASELIVGQISTNASNSGMAGARFIVQYETARWHESDGRPDLTRKGRKGRRRVHSMSQQSRI